jgi:hypothetical protein
MSIACKHYQKHLGRAYILRSGLAKVARAEDPAGLDPRAPDAGQVTDVLHVLHLDLLRHSHLPTFYGRQRHGSRGSRLHMRWATRVRLRGRHGLGRERRRHTGSTRRVFVTDSSLTPRRAHGGTYLRPPVKEDMSVAPRNGPRGDRSGVAHAAPPRKRCLQPVMKVSPVWTAARSTRRAAVRPRRTLIAPLTFPPLASPRLLSVPRSPHLSPCHRHIFEPRQWRCMLWAVRAGEPQQSASRAPHKPDMAAQDTPQQSCPSSVSPGSMSYLSLGPWAYASLRFGPPRNEEIFSTHPNTCVPHPSGVRPRPRPLCPASLAPRSLAPKYSVFHHDKGPQDRSGQRGGLSDALAAFQALN